MGFDRSKVKAVPMSVLKEQDEEHEKIRPNKGFQDRVQHEITVKANNVFRLFPPHPDGGGKSFGENKCVSFLTVTRPKRNADGKVIEGEFELKPFPVFNAKVHGGLTKDPVEEYMKFAKDIAIPAFCGDDTDKANLIWEEIVGNFAKKLNGIKPKDSTVVYAIKKIKDGWSKVGTLDFPKSVKQQLMEEALKFSSGDETTPDPYTDPDEGIAVVITNSGEGATRYGVSMDTVKKRVEGLKAEVPVPVPTPLTDEQGEEWMKLEPLYKLYVNSYKRSDFNMQIEGLKNFDEYLAKKKYGIQVFGYDQFMDILEEIDAQLPESETSEGGDGPQDDAPEEDPPKKAPVVAKAAPKAPAPTVTPTTASSTSERIAKFKEKYKGK